MKLNFLFSVVCLIFFFLSSCKDQGDPVSSLTPPTISALKPDSGKAGDTISISGKYFKSTRGSNIVSFGSKTVATYLSWNDTAISVIVPSGISSGSLSVTVKVGTQTSNAKTFKSLATTLTSFANDILPLFTTTYGCTGCHGGQNNLFLDSYAHVTAGNSLHGPVITPGNGAGSVLVKKLRTNTLPFGARMPFNAGEVSNADLQKVIDWINQGAQNN